ncbi:ATPase [Actinobacteria bacterium YIM 96077]|uniref:ATPase n=2 Tax=Phytoactinopolyspora halophila TaxID=1981511 RepID=A0A329R0G8_9ACTN|nr:ATPase [Actinobacteria bacterium YIM 96077]RAW17479.1 ATPase [Phytoactinopolyspora halophila]
MGLDIGGTSTRALVVDMDGNRVGMGRGPGANLTSHALDSALAGIAQALRNALERVDDPGAVRHAVVGTAGMANLAVPEVAEAFARTWRNAGLECGYDVVGDVSVAFTAGTAEPAGTLLLSGTGASAIRFDNRNPSHAVDGHGWLLGDLGSGFWLGREAVRATLAALDRREEPGPLGQDVLRALLGPESHGEPSADINGDADRKAEVGGQHDLRSELIMAVHQRPPVALSELAPLVTAAVADDPEAKRIVTEAAEHLMAAVTTVRAPGDGTPLVLAGSLLAAATPVRDLVEPRLRELWPDPPIIVARDAVGGAAWLAAGRLIGLDTADGAKLHARLMHSAGGDDVDR